VVHANGANWCVIFTRRHLASSLLLGASVADIPCRLAHEAAVHREKLRVEISQSRKEQNDYLRKVETARVLDKRVDKKRKRAEELGLDPDEAEAQLFNKSRTKGDAHKRPRKDDGKSPPKKTSRDKNVDSLLLDIF
jgi:ESF2/ABP1 family protein